MIDLLISTYCRIDDFYILYERDLKLKQIGKQNIRQYGCKPKLSMGEIMTILIMFQITQFRNFKTYYSEFICVYWKNYFPDAPSFLPDAESTPIHQQ